MGRSDARKRSIRARPLSFRPCSLTFLRRATSLSGAAYEKSGGRDTGDEDAQERPGYWAGRDEDV